MIANGERYKQHCKQLNGQVLNKPQMRLFTLLKKSWRYIFANPDRHIL